VVKSERFDYVYQGLDMLLIPFRFQKSTPINGSFSCGLGFPPSYRHHLSFRVLSNQVVRCMWYSRLCSSSSKAYNTILNTCVFHGHIFSRGVASPYTSLLANARSALRFSKFLHALMSRERRSVGLLPCISSML
jgi:hypothetical protein